MVVVGLAIVVLLLVFGWLCLYSGLMPWDETSSVSPPGVVVAEAGPLSSATPEVPAVVYVGLDQSLATQEPTHQLMLRRPRPDRLKGQALHDLEDGLCYPQHGQVRCNECAYFMQLYAVPSLGYTDVNGVYAACNVLLGVQEPDKSMMVFLFRLVAEGYPMSGGGQ
jgi:hypothetical protein